MRLWVVIAVALGLSMPASAIAQPNARGYFEQAVGALHRGAFAEARDLFAQSLEAGPTTAAAFNLAVACRGTGETSRATEVLAALLEGAYGELGPSQRADATALLAEVRAEQSVLTLRVDGAETPSLRIDGRRIEMVEGAAEVRLDAGEHVVLVTAAGLIDEERRVELSRGERRTLVVHLEVRPESRVGVLALEAPSDDLVVEIVGVARGTGRIERELPDGEYVVRVSRAEARRDSRVRVEGGRTTTFRFDDPSVGEPPRRRLRLRRAFGIVGGLLLVGAGVGTALGVAYGQPVAPPVSDPRYGVIVALEVAP